MTKCGLVIVKMKKEIGRYTLQEKVVKYVVVGVGNNLFNDFK